MRKRDRFDDDALEFVFEDAAFRDALENQSDVELAMRLGQLMCERYGSEREQAVRGATGEKKRKASK